VITFRLQYIEPRSGETVLERYDSMVYTLADAVGVVEDRLGFYGGEAEIYDGKRCVMQAGRSSGWRCVNAAASPFRRLGGR
jgi:hypothetical protein